MRQIPQLIRMLLGSLCVQGIGVLCSSVYAVPGLASLEGH